MAEVNGLDSLDINQSLGRLLWNCVEKRPHDIAVVSTWQVAGDTHVKWSYESLSSMATSLANVLQILDQRGSHVFAVLGNSAEWALVLWSAAKTGRTFICVDPRTRPDDMCYFLQLIQPTVLIVQSDETAENLDNLQPSANCIKLTCSPTSRNGWQCLYDPMKG
jgi:acyl-CoA synthetase (AMP-forming)/AMP-acid ligase II